jgi:hypothetical protein
MGTVRQELEAFFGEYEARVNSALREPPQINVEATARAFADCFIAADPNGVSCGKNDEQFRTQIPKGLEFYRSIGTKSMQITSLAITALDDYHTMVKVAWEALYKKQDGSEERIDFNVIYLVQTIGEKPKIFGYITGDEQQLYREKGLIPG